MSVTKLWRAFGTVSFVLLWALALADVHAAGFDHGPSIEPKPQFLTKSGDADPQCGYETAPPFSPWCAWKNFHNGYGFGTMFEFQTMNAAGKMVSPAWINPGILDSDDGHENGDIDLGVSVNGVGRVMGLRGDCVQDELTRWDYPRGKQTVPCIVFDNLDWQIGGYRAPLGRIYVNEARAATVYAEAVALDEHGDVAMRVNRAACTVEMRANGLVLQSWPIQRVNGRCLGSE